VPAFLVAQSLSRSAQRRDPDRAESALALTLVRYMRIVGGVMLAGAAGMLWAGADTRRIVMVVLGVALLVNALAIAMLIAVVRRPRR
jgi:NaMN:DMB phosphoribosyltransferase